MATFTPFVSLRKETGTEFYNVATTLNDNWEKIDALFNPAGVGSVGAKRALLRDVVHQPAYDDPAGGAMVDLRPTWNSVGTLQVLNIDVGYTTSGAGSRALSVKRGGNEIFGVDITTNAAVNGMIIRGTADGFPQIVAVGTAANVSVQVVPKGTGGFSVVGSITSTAGAYTSMSSNPYYRWLDLSGGVDEKQWAMDASASVWSMRTWNDAFTVSSPFWKIFRVGTSTRRWQIDTPTIGFGVNPTKWLFSTGRYALQLGAQASVTGLFNSLQIGTNWYDTGSGLARLTNNASGVGLYFISGSTHIWYGDVSGAADSAFTPTERMKLDVNGQVTLRGTVQPLITVASGAPGSPLTGDLWIW